MKTILRLTASLLVTVSASIPAERSDNWSGKYSVCERHSELQGKGHLNLGVRFSTSNDELATEFARALDFWATVLDMEWREVNSRSCTIQIVDGRPDLFTHAQIARAQLPNRAGFQGWIAFHPNMRLSADEEFLVAVHELGHIFGLPHNSSAWSVMFYVHVDEPFVLDQADLKALAARHSMRVNRLDQPVLVTAPVLSAAVPRASAGN